MAYFSTYIPMSECQKVTLEKLLSREFSRVQIARIYSYFSGLFMFEDLDELRQQIQARGNVFFNHLVYCMKRDKLIDEVHDLLPPYAYYRFVWLCLDGEDDYFVLCKGHMWQGSEDACRALGESYFPDYDVVEGENQPQLLLTTESRALCQQPVTSGKTRDYDLIVKETQGVCHQGATVGDMGLILSPAWQIFDGYRSQYIYYLTSFDMFYFSHAATIEAAMFELFYM